MIPDNLISILTCPDCGGDIHKKDTDLLQCGGCERSFPITSEGIICMLPTNPKPLPDSYNDPDYQKMSENFDDSSSYFTKGNSLFKMIHESSHRTISAWRNEDRSGDNWLCDIGCGQGYHYHFFNDLSKVIGIDIRLESLNKIRAQHPDAILIQANSCSLPLKKESIGKIISIYALEHIYHLDETLEEMKRILLYGGKLFIGLPCEGGLAWNLGRKLTSERTMSKRYNVDYKKYIALEHCNNASRVITHLKKLFKLNKKTHFPLPFIPAIWSNLTTTVKLTKE